jgi:hypothetical protein
MTKKSITPEGVIALKRLFHLEIHIQSQKAEQRLEVERARRNGATWKEIAEMMYVSPQAAWERFSERQLGDEMPGSEPLPPFSVDTDGDDSPQGPTFANGSPAPF